MSEPGLSDCEAVIFDLDGVVTRTASLHALAWKRTFDDVLRQSLDAEAFRPFDIETDYPMHVDGKPRYDGVRDFLDSRGLSLPWGSEDDPPDRETICGVGNRKNVVFRELLGSEGVEVYASSVELIRKLRERGIPVGMVTSSRNGREVLQAAGLEELFDVRLDGMDAARLGLPGKPAPDTFLEVAERLGVERGRAAVLEDARSGVRAAAEGHFGLVIGVDRGGEGDALTAAGADLVVRDLAELIPEVEAAGRGAG